MTDDLEAALRAIPLCGDHVQWGKSHDGECLGCDLEAARAALAEMRGRVCGACKHSGPCPIKTILIGSVASTMTCGAWAAKEQV